MTDDERKLARLAEYERTGVLAHVSPVLRAALASAGDALAAMPCDWAADPRRAWVYGVMCGWGDDALAEIAAQFGWDAATVAKLRRFRDAVADVP